ncbi:2412_t:CDS:2 [Funneliformis mosseae]|uniref:2412_t:CDS:1 n=1 Tax=Funneliformis mosseae TaxID=27381 RepID=A0A9N9CXA8_FUNMO|nr:2412_t:CDS:2 [Funneliformis mosseae]
MERKKSSKNIPIFDEFDTIKEESDKKIKELDSDELCESNSESECDEYLNNQAIDALENLLKEKLNVSYKLKLTALLQYLRLIDYEEPKIKANISII